MENPAISLFQGESLNLNNSQNQEEAEDWEEQVKRREELQNLLTAALDDFKYEDSTINSSSDTSAISIDNYVEETYKNVKPNDQLKLLYEIRTKEIQRLREEYDAYKTNTTKDIDGFKRKLLLAEAETRQVEISLQSTKSLLVEKSNLIDKYTEDIQRRDLEIDGLKTSVEHLQMDVAAYKGTIDELQLKMHMEIGPFNVASRVFSAEELQKAHGDQVTRLEILLEEQKKKSEHMENEKKKLENELNDLVVDKNEHDELNNNTLVCLSNTLQGAQDQCKDLVNLLEMMSKENDHYRDRIQKLESNDPIFLSNSFKRKSLDYNTLQEHNDRLKRMLIDKDVEITSLKSKVKFYDSDIKELMEYRNLKCTSYISGECAVAEHSQKIAYLEKELHTRETSLKDKEQKILNLTMDNKELSEKVEEMILQTREDLENISHKYKLPELENMSEELKNAEEKIATLQNQVFNAESEVDELRSQIENDNVEELKFRLQEKQERISALEKKINEPQACGDASHMNESLLSEIQQLKSKLAETEKYVADYTLIKKQLSTITEQLQQLDEVKTNDKDFDSLWRDMENFWHIYKTTSVNQDLLEIKFSAWLNQLKLSAVGINNVMQSLESLQEELKLASENLHYSQNELERLTEIIDDINNSKTILEGEKSNFECKLKEYQNALHVAEDEIISLKNDIEAMSVEKKSVAMQTIYDANKQLDRARHELSKYKDELTKKCNIIKCNDANIEKLESEVESLQSSLNESENEIIRLQTLVSRNNEENVRRNFEPEMMDAETSISKSFVSSSNDSLQNSAHLEAEMMQNEVRIREEVRLEYNSRIRNIEETYKGIFEVNKQKLNEYKNQENVYRQQLAELLNKYARIITPIQSENTELKDHLAEVETHYQDMKKYVATCQNEYALLVEKTQNEAQKSIDAWKMWAKTFVQGCLGVEKTNCQSRDTIINSLNVLDSHVNSVEKYYEDKIRQYKKKNRLVKT